MCHASGNNRNPIPEQRKNVAEKLNQAMQIMMNFFAIKPFGITMSLLRAMFQMIAQELTMM
jgi:hypothetical protein